MKSIERIGRATAAVALGLTLNFGIDHIGHAEKAPNCPSGYSPIDNCVPTSTPECCAPPSFTPVSNVPATVEAIVRATLTAEARSTQTPFPTVTPTFTPIPTSTFTPVPNVPATVEAQVRATLTAFPPTNREPERNREPEPGVIIVQPQVVKPEVVLPGIVTVEKLVTVVVEKPITVTPNPDIICLKDDDFNEVVERRAIIIAEATTRALTRTPQPTAIPIYIREEKKEESPFGAWWTYLLIGGVGIGLALLFCRTRDKQTIIINPKPIEFSESAESSETNKTSRSSGSTRGARSGTRTTTKETITKTESTSRGNPS